MRRLPLGVDREAYLSAQSYPPTSFARLSRPNEDQKRPQSDCRSPRKRPQAFGGQRLQEVAAVADTFRPEQRLKRRADFRRVQSQGERVHTPSFVVLLAASPTQRTRLGITVTKKVGHAATRNRIKRLVREVFRRQRNDFPAGCDVVVIAKRNLPASSFDDVSREITRARGAIRRAGGKALKSGTS